MRGDAFPLAPVAGILLGVLAAGTVRAGGAAAPRVVRLKTADGWVLEALYTPARGKDGVVLLHGLDAGKGEWASLVKELARRHVATLAVDLRGHGGSLGPDKKRNWRTFADHGPGGEWARMWRDAEAAVRYLKGRGFGRVGVAGASIGANIAFAAAAKLPGIRFAALLSPGVDYQGLRPQDSFAAYGPRPILLAASRTDEYALQSSMILRQARLSAKLPVEWVEAGAGHGVQMFSEPGVLRRIADWIAAESALGNAIRPRKRHPRTAVSEECSRRRGRLSQGNVSGGARGASGR